MKKRTIVIFGVSSFVGSNLAMFLKENYRVIGTYYQYRVVIPGVLTVPCDILSRDGIQMVLYTFKPDITIYAAGLSSIEHCSNYEKYADALNTGGVFNTVSFTERYKSKLIYLSSAYIFSGENKLNHENDTPLPNTVLGKTKASSEFYIQKSCLNYVVFRCCNFYGRSLNPRQVNWFERMERKLFKSDQVGMDSKIIIGFLDIYYLAEAIKVVIEENITNRLFQISSSDSMTHFDFTKLYLEIFRQNVALVKKSNWDFRELDSPVVDLGDADKYYYMLDTENIEYSLGLKLPSIRESLEATYKGFGGGVQSSRSSKKTGDITFI